MSLYPVTLDTIASIQHEVSFNQLANAISASALFGVRQSKTNGLRLTLYGGNFPTVAGPVHLNDSAINLTASATNYIYVDTAGVVFKVTSPPSGWPGPMPAGYRALYQLTVGANAITSGTNYCIGPSSPGPDGPIGATGPSGPELWTQRKRLWEANGDSSTVFTGFGFAVTYSASAGPNARALATTNLSTSLNYTTFGGTGVGGSGQMASQNFCYLGNAAGRGGFDITFRWSMDATFFSTNARRFIGLYDGSGFFGNVEPDTAPNIIGVGSKAGDANLSVIHNDASGTATMATLGANFPAITTGKTYELRLLSVANSGTVSYTITDVATGNQATGTISSDLPATTQFLAWYMWTNTGSQSTTTLINFMQVVAYTRY